MRDRRELKKARPRSAQSRLNQSLVSVSLTCIGLTGLVMAMSPRAALAGGVGSSGGGAAIVCRNAKGSIHHAELLDLYEGQARYGYTLASSSGQLETDFIQANERAHYLQGRSCSADPTVDDARDRLRDFFNIVHFTSSCSTLPLLQDLGDTVTAPSGCAIEQLAIFHDTENEVDIDSEIWDALDPLNQAALVSHELYYRYERTLAETTSELTRGLVSAAYSSAGPIPATDALPPASVHCTTSSQGTASSQTSSSDTGADAASLSDFYVYPRAAGTGTVLQFTKLMGRPVFSKATAEFPGLLWNLQSGGAAPTPADPSANLTLHTRVTGARPEGYWEVTVAYAHSKPVLLSLYEKGALTGQAVVDECSNVSSSR